MRFGSEARYDEFTLVINLHTAGPEPVLAALPASAGKAAAAALRA